MSLHRFHPNDDDPPDAVLWDDCERCQQHTVYPYVTLDKGNIRLLWALMLDVERRMVRGRFYRTRAEAQACRNLWYVAVFLEREAGLDPEELL